MVPDISTEEADSTNGKHNKEDRKEEVEEKVDYDQLLTAAGEFGLFQIFLFISSCPFYFFGVFAYFSQLFITTTSQNYWCWIPELANLTIERRKNLAIPNDTDSRFGYSQCTSYVANWSMVLSTGARPDASWGTEPCQAGWEFDKAEIPYPTISSELGWVCDRSSYQATAQSIFFVGSIVGGFLVGWVADRYGRLYGAAFSNIIGCVVGIATTFVTDFTQFVICRFFMGMAYDNCMIMTYLLLLEYVAPKYRALSANAPFAIFFTTGLCALPWIALACGDWKVLSLATSIPMGLAILAPLIMPESPRWLLNQGRIDDAVNKVINISKVNRKVIPPKLIEQFKITANKEKEERGNIFDLLRRPSLRLMFICICIVYTCAMTAFDALVRAAGHLDFDFFLSFTVVSLTEFPSLLILTFILDWTGRKWLAIVAMVVSGLFSIIISCVPTGLPSVMCAVVSRFFVNMACNTAMQWAAEVLPTPVRGVGVSVVHICGYVGTVISPYVVYLDTIIEWLPVVVVGAILFVGAVACLALPETTGLEMPQTFDVAEDMMRKSKFLYFPCACVRKKKEDVKDTPGQVNDLFEMY